MMDFRLLNLFHFITFTFGFIVLIYISRKTIVLSDRTRKLFIGQALFYNLTIVFMAIEDVIVAIYSKNLSSNQAVSTIRFFINEINICFYILWCIAFVLLVYSFLEKPITKRFKTITSILIVISFFLLLYKIIAYFYNLTPFIQREITRIFSYTIVFITIYSYKLYRECQKIENLKNTKSLKVFGLMFFIFSIITILHYTNLFYLKHLKGIFFRISIFSLDFLFNLLVIAWSIKYLKENNSLTIIENTNIFDENSVIAKYQISKRELEIIKLVCEGRSNQEIADTLFISLGTVKNHIYNIYSKLGIKNRTQLVKMF